MRAAGGMDKRKVASFGGGSNGVGVAPGPLRSRARPGPRRWQRRLPRRGGAAAQTARFVGKDTTTLGNWRGKLDSGTRVMTDEHASGASVAAPDVGVTWARPRAETAGCRGGGGPARATWYGAIPITVTQGASPRQVAL